MEVFVYLTIVMAAVLAFLFVRSRFMSFDGQKASEYVGLGPDFDIATHLGGRNVCEGVIFGPTGRVTSRFNAVMTGTWTGKHGVVEVEFAYDGGSAQTRVWSLDVSETGRIAGEADDVVGPATGRIVGPAVQIRYRIVLPEDAGGLTLSVNDWMYLTDGGTIVNRSQFRKGGFLVAELVATIRKDSGV